MPKASSWFNKDGLVVNYGTRTVQAGGASQIKTFGDEQALVLRIPDATKILTAATAATNYLYAADTIANSAFIPAGSLVTEVRITADVACTSGGAADIELGTYTVSSTTGLYVVDDVNGLCEVGNSALANFDVAGESLVINANQGGLSALNVVPAYLAKVTTVNLWVAPISSVAYTAGAFSIVVKYVKPVQ